MYLAVTIVPSYNCLTWIIVYISVSQTFLSAGTGNQLNKFRGTPALEYIPIDVK